MDNENPNMQEPRHHKRPAPEDSTLKLRNWLNAIFMAGAVIGVLIYFFSDHAIGTIVILVAMVFKIVETAMRLMH